MPYRIQWYIPDKVLFSCLRGEVTLDEFREYLVSTQTFYEQAQTPPLHNILDTRLVTQYLSLTDTMKTLPRQPHPNMGWIIQVVSSHSLLRQMTTVVTHILGIRHMSFNTLEEGLNFLRQQDPAIPWGEADSSILKG